MWRSQQRRAVARRWPTSRRCCQSCGHQPPALGTRPTAVREAAEQSQGSAPTHRQMWVQSGVPAPGRSCPVPQCSSVRPGAPCCARHGPSRLCCQGLMSLPTSCTARCHMHNVMNNLPLSTRLSRWSQHFSPRRPIAAAMSSLLHPAYPNTKPPVPPSGTEPLAAVTPDYQHAVLAASPLLPSPLPTHKPLLTLSMITKLPAGGDGGKRPKRPRWQAPDSGRKGLFPAAARSPAGRHHRGHACCSSECH